MAEVAEQEYEARVDIERLQEHPKNAKKHDIAAIQASITNTGFVGAVYAQKSTGYILAGHGTTEAAAGLGITQVPVIWVDLEDGPAEDFLIAANRAQELGGGYDEELMATLLEGAAERGTLEAVGYNMDDYEDLLAAVAPQYTPEVEFDGGYADDATERMGAMPEGPKPQRGLREKVIVLDVESFELLEEHLRMAKGEYGPDRAATDSQAILLMTSEWASKR